MRCVCVCVSVCLSPVSQYSSSISVHLHDSSLTGPLGKHCQPNNVSLLWKYISLTASKEIGAAHLFWAWFKIRKRALARLPLAAFIVFQVRAADLDMVDSRLPPVFISALLCSRYYLTNPWVFLFYNSIIIKYLLLLV